MTFAHMSEAKWLILFNAISDYVSVHDTNHRVLFANQALIEFLGVAPEKIIGKRCHELFHCADTPWHSCPFVKTIKSQKPVSEEVDDPKIGIPLLITTSPVFDQHGKLEAVIHIARDISLQKKTEQKLKKAVLNAEKEKAKTESILASIGEGISIQDTDYRILYQNPAHKKMVGDHQGSYCYAAYEKRENICSGCPVALTFADRETHKAERILKTEKGLEYYEISSSPMLDNSGNIIASIEVVRDRTEQKRAELEKESLQAQLLQAQKMESLGLLAGGVAHDFNNLLSIILGYSNLALCGLTDNINRQEYFQYIQEAGEKSAGLVRQLLTFSRKQPLQKEILPVNDLVENSGRMLVRLLGETVDIEIHTRAQQKIYADPGQIEQIIMNLAVNARDAMPGGGRLTIETEDLNISESILTVGGSLRPGNYVQVKVIDTGTGLDNQLVEKMFDPFFTTKDPCKGTGLGLAVVYGIVQQHEGGITVSSRLNEGSRFILYFPVAENAAVDNKQENPCGVISSGAETILVVDDNPSIRKLLSKTLGMYGYQVLVAAGGHEALGLSDTYPGQIDLLLSDIGMPEMNGFELARELQQRRTGLKTLFMSGYSSDSSVKKQGYKDLSKDVNFIFKPFKPNQISIKIQEALRKQ